MWEICKCVEKWILFASFTRQMIVIKLVVENGERRQLMVSCDNVDEKLSLFGSQWHEARMATTTIGDRDQAEGQNYNCSSSLTTAKRCEKLVRN